MTATPHLLTDIQIAQAAKLRPIADVAAELGLGADDLELYGRYKAKIRFEALAARPQTGKLVLVTGISPTPAGEGKSTVTIGLTQALRRLGRKVVACLREPSLGPVFGVKGGATGGGYSQVVPMDDINLHFTGDFHAIAAAHNLLSAMLDAHLHYGNALAIDARRVLWPRTIDMNDRALRRVVVGLGGINGGVTREDRFVIIPGSEVMAILALAADRQDLEARLARIVVGVRRDKGFVCARDLRAEGAMTLLLKDAIRPNLVQTLEGGPALVHCGPFGNIAHGCSSVVATKAGLTMADLVLTEAGFGADLGAEKFFNIKCRSAGLEPQAAVVVATVRALKMHGGVARDQLGSENVAAVERGVANLRRHVQNVQRYGVPVIVALNRFSADTAAEIGAVKEACDLDGARFAACDVWGKGGEGGVALAEVLLDVLNGPPVTFRPLYDVRTGIKEKIERIAREVYGAARVEYGPNAERALEMLPRLGLGQTPICMAKTPYSFSDDPTAIGAPSGFTVHVWDLIPSAGAGFVVALLGEIMTMPGLPKSPAAERMRLLPDGTIEGLS